MRVYISFILMNLKGQMQFRASFFLTIIGQFITAWASFFSLTFVLDRVEAVEGFTSGQVMLCFAVIMAAFSLGELAGGGLAAFSRLVIGGELDRVLVRPRGLIAQIIVPNMDFTRLGLLAQSGVVLAYAMPRSGVAWSAGACGVLTLMILCGAVLFFSLFLLKAAISFFTIQNLEFLNVLTYGARKFGRYPFSAYGQDVLRFLTYIVPLALVQVYPLQYLTGRTSSLLCALSPLGAPLFLLPCLALFKWGLRRYQSTGS